MLPSKLRTMLDKKDWVFLTMGVGAAVGLGFSTITRGSVWFDEAFSEHITRHSFFDILRYTAADVHPPLYYWALKIWRMLFGSSELALRSLSLFFLAATIVVVYVLVRRTFTRSAAITSMTLLVLSPMLCRYGVEARMYTMELFIIVAATAALLAAVRTKSRKAWMVYGVLIGLGMLTHYLSAMVWAAQGLWLLAQYRQKTIKTSLAQVLKAGYGRALLAALAVSLLWLPFMAWQVINIQGGGFWIGAVSLNTLPNYVSNAYTYINSVDLQGWKLLLLLAAVSSGGYVVYHTHRALGEVKKQAYSLLLWTALLPPLLLFLASTPPLRSSFVDRYLIASIALWFVVVGIALARYTSTRSLRKLGILFLALNTVVLVGGILQVFSVGNFNKDSNSIHTMRSAMQLINASATGTEPVLADMSWRYYEASYYEQLPHRVYFRSEDTTKIGAYEMLRSETTNKILDMNAFAAEHPTVWFITAQARNTPSLIPKGWTEIKTYQMDAPSELRVVKIQFTGSKP